MESFRHNGILVLQPPEPRGLVISIRGIETNLNELQEEMAIAWARYVEDSIFIENFMMDFSRALGLNQSLSLEEVDFSNAIEIVESERAIKEAMTKEEKKSAREARKAERELLKEHYGFAEVDGVRMELGNYQTEPSGIFMGRGEHPLRGRWKKGVTKKDITLNLSPSAPRPDGDWGGIVWAPDTMWIAKWTDELTNKV
ncbi:MAG: DNA topoisomerase I, partial [Candidatus Thorarchaeota archaeon]